MNIEWDYSYYQPWSDNEWLVDEMIAMRKEMLYHKRSLTICDGCFDTLNSSKIRGQTSDKRCC